MNTDTAGQMSAFQYGQKTIGSIHEDCSGFDFQPLSQEEQKKVLEQSMQETKKSDNK